MDIGEGEEGVRNREGITGKRGPGLVANGRKTKEKNCLYIPRKRAPGRGPSWEETRPPATEKRRKLLISCFATRRNDKLRARREGAETPRTKRVTIKIKNTQRRIAKGGEAKTTPLLQKKGCGSTPRAGTLGPGEGRGQKGYLKVLRKGE